MIYRLFNSPRQKVFTAAFAATIILGLTSSATLAQSQCMAGVAPFKAGQKGISINHATMKPYTVVVQATNTAGYSPTSAATYFNVLKIKKDRFQVQHKRTDDGVPVALDYNVSLGWIACTK